VNLQQATAPAWRNPDLPRRKVLGVCAGLSSGLDINVVGPRLLVAAAGIVFWPAMPFFYAFCRICGLRAIRAGENDDEYRRSQLLAVIRVGRVIVSLLLIGLLAAFVAVGYIALTVNPWRGLVVLLIVAAIAIVPLLWAMGLNRAAADLERGDPSRAKAIRSIAGLAEIVSAAFAAIFVLVIGLLASKAATDDDWDDASDPNDSSDYEEEPVADT